MLYLEKMKMILGIDRERKIVNIKGLAKFTKARYKSSKSILKHIRDLTKVQDDWEDNKCFGTALNEGMQKFKGDMIFTSHDHQLTQTVANRIIDLRKDKIIDRECSYNEYLGIE